MIKRLLTVLSFALLVGCTQQFEDVSDQLGTDLELDREISCVESDAAFFSRAVWPTLTTTCEACHEESQVASDGPEFRFSSDQTEAYQQVRNYIAASGETFVRKPTMNGASHSGGRLIEQDSVTADNLLEMVQRIASPVGSCADETIASEAPGFEDVDNIGAQRTVRKAAILMQGRMPSAQELSLATASDSDLRSVLRSYLEGPVFEQWLKNSANDHLLTRKYMTGQTDAQEALAADMNQYSGLYDRTSPAFDSAEQAELACADVGGSPAEDAPEAECREAQQLRQIANTTFRETERAIAEEPLELIRYVVTRERPYSEILTADYRMMNPFTYDIFDGSSWTDSYDPMDADDWRPGQLRRFRLTWSKSLTEMTGLSYVPAAGVLSSPVFLLRYPSTDTNRNRARARWTYNYFLGVDIERLAVRAMDPQELKSVTNPGAEGTSCFGCHQVMDPVAGAFQSWGNDSQFLGRSGLDSLPPVYVETHPDYVEGDQWFRGQLQPGFGGIDMPVVSAFGKPSSHTDGLQWLGEQLVNDPRFATGTAKFWFKGLFGRDPLLAPTETTDADYQARLQAYQEEQALIDLWGDRFAAANFNLKDLLVDMMMSPLYRAESISSADSQRLAALDQLGLGRLLTPEQLDRKISATLDFDWKNSWQSKGQLLEDYYMLYGGIDSDGITERPATLNSMMLSVAYRLSNEISCEVVLQEFWPGKTRVLFPEVSITTDPNTDAGEAAIRRTIDNLMWRLWGTTDPLEQDALWLLYKDIYDERIAWASDDDSQGGVFVPNYLGYAVAWDDNQSDTALDESCAVNDYDPADDIAVELDWEGIASSDWSDPERVREHLGSYYNPEQTLRPWVAVLSVMLSDIQFVTE